MARRRVLPALVPLKLLLIFDDPDDDLKRFSFSGCSKHVNQHTACAKRIVLTKQLYGCRVIAPDGALEGDAASRILQTPLGAMR